MPKTTVHVGDSRDVLKTLADNSVHSIVTDPPYGLVSIGKRFGKARAKGAKAGKTGAYARASKGFMGKTWDTGEVVHDPAFWAECLRVLVPGGHIVAFSGTRTQHRQTCAIEDAGFEIRDMLAWLYGTGFPKSHDVAKGVDKMDAVGPRHERALKFTAWMRTTGVKARAINSATKSHMASHYLTAKEQPEVPTADMFDLMRPLLPEVPAEIEALVAARTVESENLKRRAVVGEHSKSAQAARWRADYAGGNVNDPGQITTAYTAEAQEWEGWGTALKPALEPICLGRKPLIGTVAANVLAYGTGALNVGACMVGPDDAGRWPANVLTDGALAVLEAIGVDVSRVFYTAKADGVERLGSGHPTVKPVDLMRWLCRLVTPPGGVVLDPFAGSGSTGVAAICEGFDSILIERDPAYALDIERRLAWARGGGGHTASEIGTGKDKPETPEGFDALGLFNVGHE